MKKKNIFRYPKEIYIFWISDFILGLELIGSVLLIFFKDWGGLNQTETQTLQSWFMFWIFILEIPTGIFGDIKGTKYSVLLGYGLTAIGTLVYTITPDIWLFFLAEFIFALGIAFISGSKEAWMYETTKKCGIEKDFRDISAKSNSMHLFGMIISSGLFILISKILPVQIIFRSGIILYTISAILLGVFVPSINTQKDNSLTPDYKKTIKEGFLLLRENINLRRIAIYTAILSSTAYFVIWLYQEALRVIDIPESYFGAYRIVLLIAEIIAVRLFSHFLEKHKSKYLHIFMIFVVAAGFFVVAIYQNPFGILSFLALTGGLGLQIPTLLSKETNGEIDSEKRATVLSFISMGRRILLTVFNPLVGLLVDNKGVFLTLLILGLVTFSALFFLPRK